MMHKIPYFFTRPFPHGDKVKVFRKLLYIFLLLHTLTFLPILDDLFGYFGIVGSRGWNTNVPVWSQGSNVLLNALSHPLNASNPWLAYAFVFGQIAALIAGLFNFLPRISSILIYLLSVNLFFKGYAAFTGGEVLIGLMLFYLIFIDENKQESVKRENGISSFQNVINNTFFCVMLIQVCVVYFFSTWYKLIDPNWTDGMALTYIARIDHFSSAPFQFLFADNPTLSKIGVYITLIYQILFPIVVWVKKVKLPFLVIGVLLHLGIAIGMGIFGFGIVMILMYILFLEDHHVLWIKREILRQ